jgi:hypothetical protein
MCLLGLAVCDQSWSDGTLSAQLVLCLTRFSSKNSIESSCGCPMHDCLAAKIPVQANEQVCVYVALLQPHRPSIATLSLSLPSSPLLPPPLSLSLSLSLFASLYMYVCMYIYVCVRACLHECACAICVSVELAVVNLNRLPFRLFQKRHI